MAIEYNYDIDNIKNNLSLSQVADLLLDLNADPEILGDTIISRTVCHGGNSKKLYYYDNTKLFHCFTDCGDSFDCFELVLRVKRQEQSEFTLSKAVFYVAQFFGIAEKEITSDGKTLIDWGKLSQYEKIKDINISKQKIELKEYTNTPLNFFPKPFIKPWEKEGISKVTMDDRGICYDPKNQGIVIPHYDENNRLIGIRERTIVKENEIYGKYRPAYIAKKLYNHPLGLNLYNFNKSKENIKRIKKAIVFESEKSCLMYASYFGFKNDISVAICGSSFSAYQMNLLLDNGVEEIIIALDKQFQTIGDDEFKKLKKNLINIHKKCGNRCKVSFMFDKWGLLGYKEAPIDRGPQVFMELFKRRFSLY